jgi:hypothetical protein
VCAAAPCACRFDANGDGLCDGPLTDGTEDPDDCAACWAGACGSPSLSWWDTLYTRRRQLAVTNNAGAVLAAGVHLSWDPGALRSHGHGLRIARWDGASWTELPRDLDAFSPNLAWFRAAAAIAGASTDVSYWAYYAPAALPASSYVPADVFDFYESFDGFDASTTTRWRPSSTAIGTVAYGGDTYVRLSSAASDQMHTNDAVGLAWGATSAVDIRWRVSGTGGPWWLGFQGFAGSPNIAADAGPWVLWIQRTSGLFENEYACAAGASIPSASASRGAYTVDTDYVSSIDRFDTALSFRTAFAAPSALTACAELGTGSTPLAVRLDIRGPATFLDVDMVRIRRTILPLPSVATTGAEQSAP